VKNTLVLVISATVIGVLTGVVVIGVEHLVEEILHEIQEAEPRVIGIALTIGALLAALLVRYLGGRSSSTTEAYVEKFHEEDPPLQAKYAPGRLAASVSTLGSGATMGMELQRYAAPGPHSVRDG
jgi:H+/Cl- antiporter ClcA